MIGVFDSGVGGLTVLKGLVQKYSHKDFIYLGDTARLPYGSKSPQTLKKYLHQNIQFLLSHKVEAIVVACNSASSVMNELDEYPVPVYNVIDSSAELAVKTSLDEKIGVIATRTTVEQKAYVKKINSINPHVSVFQQACPLFVPLAEEGLFEDPITNLIAYRYLSPLLQVGIDTLILGCTHYPLLHAAIRKVMGAGVTLISSAEAILQKMPAEEVNDKKGRIQFFTTDLSPHFLHLASLLFNEHHFDRVELVNIG